jgi:hypothetical protein
MYSPLLRFCHISSFDRLWLCNLLPCLLVLALGLFGISSTARALIPAPDGGYSDNNTAEGDGALSNGGGTDNTAIGFDTLFNDTSGGFNTATGSLALSNNTTGSDNTAAGAEALDFNKTGNFNTAIGSAAMLANTSGSLNTATGVNALALNTTGVGNTADGFQALDHATTGDNNTATGRHALFNNTTGSSNIALGFNAGINLTTGNNNIEIGAAGIAAEANTIRIGKQGTQKQTFIAGIFGVAVTGSTVVVNSNGKLGVATSAARFKKAVQPMNQASEAILGLKPVTFRYKEEIDPDGTPQFGLIAEEVEKVNPDLVGRDENGKVITVRYEAVNAMLLNEFLKEHRRVEEQGATIVQMKKEIEALTAGLQKVSAQLELNKPAPQLMADNQ